MWKYFDNLKRFFVIIYIKITNKYEKLSFQILNHIYFTSKEKYQLFGKKSFKKKNQIINLT